MRDSFWQKSLQIILGADCRTEVSSKRQRSRFAPRFEELERRLTPAAPVVLSIDRTTPANTNASTVEYVVTFDQPVAGVDASDFKIATDNSLAAPNPIVVSGGGASYFVAVNGIHGSGDLRLDLIDNDSIAAGGLPLGGMGASNGSFRGQTYTILQALPSVTSISRDAPAAAITNATTVSFMVTFSTEVTGVDSSDFSVATTGNLAAFVAAVTGGGAVYDVPVRFISGNGTISLSLINDGSIHDLAGNPLATPSDPASFQTKQTIPYSLNANLRTVLTCDVNGDGKPDLVTTNYGGYTTGNSTVNVLLGNGNGTFQPQVNYPVGLKPRSATSGDFNGDGRADLAVANIRSGTISVLLGNGDGTFKPQQTFSAGSAPSFVAAGDVNGDGKLDFVSASNRSAPLVLLLGNGDGTFQSPLTVGNGPVFSPYSLVLADLNGDGKLDLTATNSNQGPVNVLLGNGDGTFQAEELFSTGGVPLPALLAVSDLNGDGKPDIVVDTRFYGPLGVLMGNGDGTFQAAKTFATGNLVGGVATGDVNGDGKPDIVVTNYSGGPTPTAAAVLLGNGNGTFQAPKTFGSTRPTGLALDDLNGDGKLDIVTADGIAGTLSVLLGSGNGKFKSSQDFAAGLGDYPNSAALGDVSGDGKPDLIVTNNGASSVGISLGNGDGTFQPRKTFATLAQPTALVVSDLNGDGKLDLAIVDTHASAVSILLGNGDGAFQTQKTFNAGSSPNSVAVGDVNGDGKPDLAIVNAVNGPNVVRVFLGVGDGTFVPRLSYAVGAFPAGVAMADVNGDGKADLAVANRNSNSVSVLLGNGDGAFQAQQTFDAGNLSLPYWVAVGDLNADGKPDLAVANNETGNVGVLLGNGNGTFQAQQTLNMGAGSQPTSVVIGDVNADGKADLVVPANGKTYLFVGNGDGSFRSPQTFAASSSPGWMAIGDANGDGDVDLVVPAGALLNNGNTAGPTYTIDQVPPTVSLTAVSPNPHFTPVGALAIQFSEPVLNFDIADFTLTRDGNSVPLIPSMLTGSGTQYSLDLSEVTVSGNNPVTGNYVLKLNVSDIQDPAGNPLASNVSDSWQIAGAVTATTLSANPNAIIGGQPVTLTATVSPSPGNNGTVTFLNDGVPIVGGADIAIVGGVATFSTADFFPGSHTITATFSGAVGYLSGASNDLSFTVTSPFAIPLSINRAAPASPETNATSVVYTVTFDRAVTGVDASDFRVVTTGTLVTASPVLVSGSGSSYMVTVSGLHGSGNLRLDIIDDNSINAGGVALGGPLLDDGSFQGQSYSVLQAFPSIVSINRAAPAASATNAGAVSFTATFNTAVTGVDAADFSLTRTGSVTTTQIQVMPVSGSIYTVTVSGITGDGALGLDLIDNGSIRDMSGRPILSPNASFANQATYATGVAPIAMAVGDVNGDGKADFVVVNRNSSAVNLFLGNGDGTFQAQQSFATGDPAGSVTLGDVNGDGKLDLVVPTGNSGTVSVLLGNGDGTFRTRQTFTADSPGTVALGDVNGDGKPDLAMSTDYDHVSVLLGNGDGTFQSQLAFIAGHASASVVIGDVNGDGKPDLAATNVFDYTASVLLGNGNGTFQKHTDFPTRGLPDVATLQDVNADGNADLIVVNDHTNESNEEIASVSVLLGNGDGAFQAQQTFATGSGSNSVAVGDVNGDGKPDLAVADSNGGMLSVLLGNGDGTFQSLQTFATGIFAASVTAGDFNDDGKLDLAVINTGSNTVGEYLNAANGNFTGQSYTIDHTSPTASIAAVAPNPRSTSVGAVAIQFSETIQNFDITDLTLSRDGNNVALSPSMLTGSGSQYSIDLGAVTASAGAPLFGSYVLMLHASNIQDLAGNPLLNSTSGVWQIVAPTSTAVILAATPNATTGGQLVTFTATVAPSPGNLGTVSFQDNGALIAGGGNVPLVGGVATFQTSALSPGTHPITASYSGAAGFPASTSNTVNLLVSNGAVPQLMNVAINGNIASLAGAQRSRVASLVVVFDRAVQLDADAFALALHANNVAVDGVPQPNGAGTLPASLNFTSADNITWIVTFSGNTDDGDDGFNSLKDGVYDFTIAAAKVHPLGVPGVTMAADSSTTFHRLFGDIGLPTTPTGGTPGVDFSAIVNTADNLPFRTAFNNPLTYTAAFDFNGDGAVNTADNLQFRTRFNKALTWRT